MHWRKLTSAFANNIYMSGMHKKVREKSRECHSHKLQPFPDTKKIQTTLCIHAVPHTYT